MARQSKKLILVEHDAASVLLTRRYLERTGISNQVIHFSQGCELLRFICDKLSCDCASDDYILIMDLNLPDITGFKLLQIIRMAKIPALERTPIIIHTSSDEYEDRQFCEELGADAYCVKDFTGSYRLSDILNQYLDTCVLDS